MTGIRQQCHRPGHKAEYDLNNDINDIKRDTEREGTAEICRHVAMRALAIVMTMGKMAVVMMVTGGHLRSDYCNANILIFDYTE
jgi:hypothetical protein